VVASLLLDGREASAVGVTLALERASDYATIISQKVSILKDTLRP